MVKKNQKIESFKYPVIVIGGSIFVAIIAIALIGNPLWKSTKKNTNELKVKQEKLTSLEQRIENLKKLKEKEAELKEKNAKLLAALPTDKDVARLFVELENIASQSGVNISSVTEATATTASTSDVLKTLNYTISAKTNSYSSLRSTLEKSEQALRILTTTQISANKPNDGAMDLTLNITTFVRGQQ